MTTIAVDIAKKQVASDSRCTSGSKKFSVKKIYVMDDGTIIAFSGYLLSAQRFVAWYQAGADKANPPDLIEGAKEFEAITVNDQGVFTWDENLESVEIINDPFYCTGSGEQYALAALHLGKSVKEAIELAIELDAGSGGKVNLYEYKKKELVYVDAE